MLIAANCCRASQVARGGKWSALTKAWRNIISPRTEQRKKDPKEFISICVYVSESQVQLML